MMTILCTFLDDVVKIFIFMELSIFLILMHSR